jgi:hypothetical protein
MVEAGLGYGITKTILRAIITQQLHGLGRSLLRSKSQNPSHAGGQNYGTDGVEPEVVISIPQSRYHENWASFKTWEDMKRHSSALE